MGNCDIDILVETLKSQQIERNYWMVRTMGGRYYGDFIRNNYIAIGYNEVSLRDIEALPESNTAAQKELKNFLLAYNQEMNNLQVGHPAGQILRFVREIKHGDVVMIPSTSAYHVAIGIVEGDAYEDRAPAMDDASRCPFYKRRRVDWKVYTRRVLLPPMLQVLFASRHTVSAVNNYAPYIDSLLNDFYYKDDTMHLVLAIKTRKDVTLEQFMGIQAVGCLVDQFCEEYGLSCDEPIVMKIQMESPGWLKLSSKNAAKLFVYASIVVAINGGGVKIQTEKWNFDMSTNGFIQNVSEYLDRQADRELVEAAASAMDSLKIESPKDLQPIIEILNIKNEGREKY